MLFSIRPAFLAQNEYISSLVWSGAQRTWWMSVCFMLFLINAVEKHLWLIFSLLTTRKVFKSAVCRLCRHLEVRLQIATNWNFSCHAMYANRSHWPSLQELNSILQQDSINMFFNSAWVPFSHCGLLFILWVTGCKEDVGTERQLLTSSSDINSPCCDIWDMQMTLMFSVYIHNLSVHTYICIYIYILNHNWININIQGSCSQCCELQPSTTLMVCQAQQEIRHAAGWWSYFRNSLKRKSMTDRKGGTG